MTTRPLLSDTQKTETVLESQVAYHAATIEEIRRSVDKDAIVVVGMAQNPFVKKARRALEEANLSFTYLEYGNYFGEWKRRLAIKLWSGWSTFPQVFVRGVLIGGYQEVSAALADGSLRARLDDSKDPS